MHEFFFVTRNYSSSTAVMFDEAICTIAIRSFRATIKKMDPDNEHIYCCMQCMPRMTPTADLLFLL